MTILSWYLQILTNISVLKIVIDDVYEDLKDLSEYMDFSDYQTSHPSHGRTSRKVLCKIENELSGRIITSFIGLERL